MNQLTEAVFIQQYILARAAIIREKISIEAIIEDARRAYNASVGLA